MCLDKLSLGLIRQNLALNMTLYDFIAKQNNLSYCKNCKSSLLIMNEVVTKIYNFLSYHSPSSFLAWGIDYI